MHSPALPRVSSTALNVNLDTHTVAAFGQVGVTDSFGLVSTSDYDFRFGMPIRETDDNGNSIDGPLTLADSTDQVKRFQAANWNATHVDGFDHRLSAGGTQPHGQRLSGHPGCRSAFAPGSSAIQTW